MDRDESAAARRRTARYADEPELGPADRAALEAPAGEDLDESSRPENPTDDAVRRNDVGAVPRSAVTGRHDPGSGADETDGHDATTEATRRAAEDVSTGDGTEDRPRETPVFERGGLPKI